MSGLDVPISELPPANPLTGAELMPLVQSGATVRAAIGHMVQSVMSTLPSAPDHTPPPDVKGLSVSAAFTSIMVTWDAPTYTQGHGNGRTNIYAVQRNPASSDPEPMFSAAVLIGSSAGASSILTIPSNPNVEWHIWAKFYTNDGVLSPDPAEGTNGVVATTGQDVSTLLAALNGQITESQLFSALASKIDLINAPASTAGSVAAQVQTETSARVAALSAEAGFRSTGDSTTLSGAQTYTQNWAYSKSATDTAIAASGASLTTAYQAGDAATLTSANTYVGTYAYSKSAVDSALSALSSSLASSFAAADSATLASAESFTYSRSAINSAIASSASTLTTNYTAADAATLASAQAYTYSQSAINSAIAAIASTLTASYQSADTATLASANAYTYSRAAIDGAIASSASTLTASYTSAITSAVSTESTARATADGQLFAQWTVKLDVNNYVSGFGLASTSGTATPSSSFVVRADSFSIGNPAGPGTSAAITPFTVITTATTINGVAVPVGVYADAVYFLNGSITNAKIGNAQIDDAKITSLTVGKLLAGSIAVGQYIQSTGFVSGSAGWRITGNGVAEFSGVIVRGTMYATAGQIGGATIDSVGVQSNSYSAGSAGWRLDNSTGIVYAASLHVQDSTGTRILNTDATGSAIAFGIGSNFWIHGDGSAFFGGKLGLGTASQAAASGSSASSTVFGSSVSVLSPGNMVLIPSGTITNTGAPVTMSVQVNVDCSAAVGAVFTVSMAPTLDGSIPSSVYLDPATTMRSGQGPTGSNVALVQLSGTFRFPAAAGTHSFGVVAVMTMYSTSSTGLITPSSSSIAVFATGVVQENLA